MDLEPYYTSVSSLETDAALSRQRVLNHLNVRNNVSEISNRRLFSFHRLK